MEPAKKAFFESINEDRCPREMFVQDICQAITQWVEEGDQIVLGVDANEDIQTCSLTRRLKGNGLEETITWKVRPPTIEDLYQSTGFMSLAPYRDSIAATYRTSGTIECCG
jgi:hypothetical protein